MATKLCRIPRAGHPFSEQPGIALRRWTSQSTESTQFPLAYLPSGDYD